MAAIAYADLFGCGLTTAAVQRLAVGQTISEEEVVALVDGRITRQGDWWCLGGREWILQQVQENAYESARKIALLNKWLWIFQAMPGVLMVGVTGSVAGGNPKVGDDIDVLVICQNNRLWVSRLILTMMFSLVGKRRKPHHRDDQVKDLFCLNMWLSLESLEEQADIYVANELARIIPVLNRQQTYERYLAANSWIKAWLPGVECGELVEPLKITRGLLTRFGDWAEGLSRVVLKRAMRPPSAEIVTDERLQFHPTNHHGQILESYSDKLRELNL